MTNSFEVKGMFWLPENPERKIYGTLKYSPETGVVLDLFDVLSISKVQKTLQKYPLIYGITEDWRYATIYDAHEIYRSNIRFDDLQSSELNSKFALIGKNHLNNAESPQFHKTILHLSNIDEWIDLMQKFDLDTDDENTIRCKLPNEINIEVSDRFKLKIKPEVSISIENERNNEIVIHPKTNCTFSYTNCVSFEEILLNYKYFSEFIAICAQRQTDALEFTVYIDAEDIVASKYFVYSQLPVESFNKRPNPNKFLLKYKHIEHSFQKIVNIWFLDREKLEYFCIPYFYNLRYGQQFVGNKFTSIYSAVEALSKFKQESDGTKPIGNHQNKIKYLIKPLLTYIDSLNNKRISEDLKNNIHKIVSIRHDLAHSMDKYKSELNIERNGKYIEAIYMTKSLTAAANCYLLVHFKLSEDDINKIHRQTSLYEYVKFSKM